MALALLMAGADINAQDKDGKTALMIGIINGHQPLVELLLKRNANLGVKNEVSIGFVLSLCPKAVRMLHCYQAFFALRQCNTNRIFKPR